MAKIKRFIFFDLICLLKIFIIIIYFQEKNRISYIFENNFISTLFNNKKYLKIQIKIN